MQARQQLALSIIFLSLGIGGCNGDDNPALDTAQDTDTNTNTIGTPGCGKGENLAKKVTVNGEERTFELSLPDDYDSEQTYPLLFALHGLGGSGSLARSYFGLKKSAHNEAIVVYPDALPLIAFGGANGWDLSPTGYDLEFFDALYAHLGDKLCVDEERVYATGHSFGGYMSNVLGCYRSDVLSGIAPVAGGLSFWGDCSDQIAVWVTHGTNDDTVPFSEGASTRDHWTEHNECSETTSAFSDDCVSYDGCARDVHWCEHNGGHEWPGFAGEAIWAFFAEQ